MPSSLGLSGDLDDVELIEDIEKAFGMRLSDQDLQHCRTVGDIFALMEAQLPNQDLLGDRCATAMCFYRLRRALQPRIVFKLHPQTEISALRDLPVRTIRSIIQKECGLRPPPPYISTLGGVALLLTIAMPIAGLALGWPWWIAIATALPPIAGYKIAPVKFPATMTTFADLVRSVSSRSINRLAQEGARLRSTEAWNAFIDILSEHASIPKETIGPDTLIHTAQMKA